MSHLVYLRTFLSVYRQGSISRAAESLYLTQPAVSRHIKLLEDRLGRQLFERLPRGIAATAAAHELERLAGSHLDALEQLTDARTLARESISGTVYAGITSGFASLLFRSIGGIERYGIRLNLQVSPPPELLQALVEERVDLAITPAPIPHKGVIYTRLYRGSLVLVCAASWRESVGKSNEPRGVPIIENQGPTPAQDSYWRMAFGSAPEIPALMLPDYQTALQAAKAGLGLAAVPELLCRGEILTGQLLVAHQSKQSPEVSLYLARSRNREKVERISFVSELIRDAANTW